MHGAISFSSYLSPTAWFGCCFVSEICNCPLRNGFYSSGWYSHSPLDSFHSPGFVHVQGQENYLFAGILRVMFVEDPLGVGFPDVDLILPYLAATLANTQVLPTDSTNCKDWV